VLEEAAFLAEVSMAKTVIEGAQGLKALVGKDIGVTEWKTMTFEAIEKFADATGDHQWIHVDKERIARESPYKKPIAHGYFTVSLIAGLFFELVELKGFGMVINYGLNKVRFPAALKEGQRYRLSCKLGELKDVSNALEGLMLCAVEIEGEQKPACAAEVVFRFYAR
jgi:acyl dehydratase